MFKANNRCMDMGANMEPMMMNEYMNVPMNDQYMMPQPHMMTGMECGPIIECPCERVVNREICHHVPHIQPIHTRIVNHHVYNHSFTPQYTCSEENLCSHVYEPNNCCR